MFFRNTQYEFKQRALILISESLKIKGGRYLSLFIRCQPILKTEVGRPHIGQNGHAMISNLKSRLFFNPLVLHLPCIHLFIHSFIHSTVQHSLTTYYLLSVLRWRDSYLLLICLPWATLISKCVKFTQSLQQPYKLNANICLPFTDQENGVQIASVTCQRLHGGWIVYLEAVPAVWLHG